MAQIKNITPFVTSFERSGAFPLDKLSYFDTYAEAEALALTAVEAGTDGNTTAYFGQIFVVAEEGGNFGAYQVQRDGSLKKFGQASSAEEITGKVAELEKTVAKHTTDISNKLDKTATVNGKGFVDNAVSIGTDDIAVGESTLTATLTANNTAHDKFTKDIAANKKAIDDYIASNDAALGTTNDNLEAVKTDVASYKKTNDAAVEKNKTNIGLVDSKVDGLSTQVTQNVSDISTIKDNITTINGKLGKDAAGNDIATTYATVENFNAYKTSNDTKVNKNASDITELKEKVTGGMHYKGKFEALPAVDDYAAGDFVIVGTKEYILYEGEDGKSWDEIGDEGSHLTKAQADGYYDPKGKAQELIEALDVAAVNVAAGETIKSISEVDGKIAVEKQSIAIAQSAVSGLSTALDGKQDKITSTNKLDASLIANLPEGHNQTVKVGTVEFGADDAVIFEGSNGVAVSADATSKKVSIKGSYTNASTTAAGLMSAEDKVKLNGIAENAQVNKIETIRINGATDVVGDSGKMASLSVVEDVKAGTGIAVSGSKASYTIAFDDSVLADDRENITNLQTAVGASTDTAAVDGSLFARIAQNKKLIDANTTAIAADKKLIEANQTSITSLSNQIAGLEGSAIKEVQLNGTKIEPNEGTVNIELGALASKDKIVEADVDSTLLGKITNYISSVETAEFTVEGGKLSAKALSTDKLVQGTQELILNGGTAAA